MFFFNSSLPREPIILKLTAFFSLVDIWGWYGNKRAKWPECRQTRSKEKTETSARYMYTPSPSFFLPFYCMHDMQIHAGEKCNAWKHNAHILVHAGKFRSNVRPISCIPLPLISSLPPSLSLVFSPLLVQYERGFLSKRGREGGIVRRRENEVGGVRGIVCRAWWWRQRYTLPETAEDTEENTVIGPRKSHPACCVNLIGSEPCSSSARLNHFFFGFWYHFARMCMNSGLKITIYLFATRLMKHKSVSRRLLCLCD